ncbi:MAG TPA: GTPase, partial [Idiomarina loihiensis]|nr:GTPase [Idiomarina loihiensis]
SINERLELNSGKSSLIKAVFETAFDPDPRLMEKAIGGDEVLGFLRNFLSEKLGKDSDCLDLA